MFDPTIEAALHKLYEKVVLTDEDWERLGVEMRTEGAGAVSARIDRLVTAFTAVNAPPIPGLKPSLAAVIEYDRVTRLEAQTAVYKSEKQAFEDWSNTFQNENVIDAPWEANRMGLLIAWQLSRLNKNLEDLKNILDLRWEANRMLEIMREPK